MVRIIGVGFVRVVGLVTKLVDFGEDGDGDGVHCVSLVGLTDGERGKRVGVCHIEE